MFGSEIAISGRDWVAIANGIDEAVDAWVTANYILDTAAEVPLSLSLSRTHTTHTHTHTRTHTHTHTYTRTHTRTHTHTHTHMHTHTNTSGSPLTTSSILPLRCLSLSHAHAHTHTLSLSFTHSRTPSVSHACTHTRTRTNPRSLAHTHTYAHTLGSPPTTSSRLLLRYFCLSPSLSLSDTHAHTHIRTRTHLWDNIARNLSIPLEKLEPSAATVRRAAHVQTGQYPPYLLAGSTVKCLLLLGPFFVLAGSKDPCKNHYDNAAACPF